MNQVVTTPTAGEPVHIAVPSCLCGSCYSLLATFHLLATCGKPSHMSIANEKPVAPPSYKTEIWVMILAGCTTVCGLR